MQALQTSITNQFQSQLISIAELFAQSSEHIDFRWNAFELKFFDSLYDEKSAVTDNVIEHFDKNTYFRNIHIFIERIKNIAHIKNDTIVRNNLYICLRETVLTWYISNLKENQKRLIKLRNEMNEWIRVLLKKFRQFFNIVMTTVVREKYIMKDVKRKRKSIEYAQVITRVVKFAEMSVYNQIYLIYNDLDLKFRKDLSISLETTKMNEFLSDLDFKKEIWWEINSKNKMSYNSIYTKYSRFVEEYFQISQRKQKEYESQFYFNRNDIYNINYNRQRSMKNTIENRFYSRYFVQDQSNRYKIENVVYDRQYSNQNVFNSRNQNFINRLFVQNFAFSQNIRTSYQYDKKKQVSFHQKFIYTLYDSKTQILKFIQSIFNQQHKIYYAKNDDYDQRDYSHEFFDETEQKNAYNAQKQFEYDIETLFLQNDEQKKEIDDISHNFFVNSSISNNILHRCRNCEIYCFLNNKLHKHLKFCKRQLTMHESIDKTSQIIISDVKNVSSKNATEDITLRKWHYLMIKASIIKTILDYFCLDTKCEMSIIDREYLKKIIFDSIFRIITETKTKVRSIEINVIISNECIKLEMKISKFLFNRSVLTKITEVFHIVDNLTVKILIEMNIIDLERMKLDAKQLIIENCKNISVNLISTSVSKSKIKRMMMCSNITTISSHINQFIAAIIKDKLKNFSNRNFMFHSAHDSRFDQENDILFHIVNVNFSCVHIRNTSDDTIIISRRCRLKMLQKYENERCYLIFSNDVHFVAEQWTIHTKKFTIRALLTASIKKTSLSNKIIIYKTLKTAFILTKVANFYSKLWTNDEKIIDVSFDKWMSINLKSDAKVAVAKMYSLKSKKKQIVNQKFDKFHSQKRMQYSFESTIHDYFVFVIWRTILKSDQKSVKKRRVVVDIRTLNKIAEIDTYSMFLQFDIIFSVIECEYIFTIDATAFFHQWLIKLSDRHKFTVVTHRKQKQFNVEMMSFKNTSSYVQRKIDNILRIYKDFCRAYINDIVIFSKTLKKHVKHLHLIFKLFTNLNISLSSTKFFFDYFTIQFLRLKVDVFDLSTSKEKLKIIFDFKFSKTFQDLKTYLKFTEWLRNYISFFAQKSESL